MLGQEALTGNIDTKNQVMGALQNIIDQQDIQIRNVQEDARAKARLQLKNYYSRFYVAGCKRYFRIWKQVYGRFKTRQSMAIHIT